MYARIQRKASSDKTGLLFSMNGLSHDSEILHGLLIYKNIRIPSAKKTGNPLFHLLYWADSEVLYITSKVTLNACAFKSMLIGGQSDLVKHVQTGRARNLHQTEQNFYLSAKSLLLLCQRLLNIYRKVSLGLSTYFLSYIFFVLLEQFLSLPYSLWQASVISTSVSVSLSGF